MQKFARLAALLLIVVAVVLAILAFELGRRAAKPVQTSVASGPVATLRIGGAPRDATVVAATTLAAGTPIVPSSLRMAQLPQRPPDGYTEVDAVIGSIPLADIPAGTPLTAKLLAHGLSLALKHGERAMAVPVDERAGAGNRISPGDYVDVFLSLKASSSPALGQSAPGGTQARLLLPRLRVLAYGSQDLPSPLQGAVAAGANGGDSKTKEGSRQASHRVEQENRQAPQTAVLAVPVEDADRLLLGVQNGSLSLALRHPDDDGRPDSALFPQPPAVLAARADLSAAQRAALDRPDNRAYAGIDGLGLAGAERVAPRSGRLRRSASLPSAVEIIRGAPDDHAPAARAGYP